MKVKLLTDKHFPTAWGFNFDPIKAGTIVPVIEASNLPQGGYWINTPNLENDSYAIGAISRLFPYIHVSDSECVRI